MPKYWVGSGSEEVACKGEPSRWIPEQRLEGEMKTLFDELAIGGFPVVERLVAERKQETQASIFGARKLNFARK